MQQKSNNTTKTSPQTLLFNKSSSTTTTNSNDISTSLLLNSIKSDNPYDRSTPISSDDQHNANNANTNNNNNSNENTTSNSSNNISTSANSTAEESQIKLENNASNGPTTTTPSTGSNQVGWNSLSINNNINSLYNMHHTIGSHHLTQSNQYFNEHNFGYHTQNKNAYNNGIHSTATPSFNFETIGQFQTYHMQQPKADHPTAADIYWRQPQSTTTRNVLQADYLQNGYVNQLDYGNLMMANTINQTKTQNQLFASPNYNYQRTPSANTLFSTPTATFASPTPTTSSIDNWLAINKANINTTLTSPPTTVIHNNEFNDYTNAANLLYNTNNLQQQSRISSSSSSNSTSTTPSNSTSSPSYITMQTKNTSSEQSGLASDNPEDVRLLENCQTNINASNSSTSSSASSSSSCASSVSSLSLSNSSNMNQQTNNNNTKPQTNTTNTLPTQQTSHQNSTTSGGSFEWMKPVKNPSNGKTRTKDKYRVVYSETQRLELEKEFIYSKYITIKRKSELSQTLNLSERQIKIWFQNRRAKDRKQSRKRGGVVDGNSANAMRSTDSDDDSANNSTNSINENLLMDDCHDHHLVINGQSRNVTNMQNNENNSNNRQQQQQCNGLLTEQSAFLIPSYATTTLEQQQQQQQQAHQSLYATSSPAAFHTITSQNAPYQLSTQNNLLSFNQTHHQPQHQNYQFMRNSNLISLSTFPTV